MRLKTLKAAGLAAFGLMLAATGALAGNRFGYLGYNVFQVFDGDKDQVVADIPVKGFLREVSFSGDRKTMFVTSNRHVITKVDMGSLKITGVVDVNNDGWERFIFGISALPDGKTAYVNMLSRKTQKGEPVIGEPMVAQIDLDTGKILRSVPVPLGIANLISTQGGKTLYGIGQDLVKIDASGKELKVVESRKIAEEGYNTLPFWSKEYDNKGIALAPYYTATGMGLLMFDVATGAFTDKKLEDISMVYAMMLSPDRKRIYGDMDDLYAYDFETGKIVASVSIAEGTCYGITTSDDGRKVYAAGGGDTLTVYDAATLKPMKVVKMASDGMEFFRMPD